MGDVFDLAVSDDDSIFNGSNESVFGNDSASDSIFGADPGTVSSPVPSPAGQSPASLDVGQVYGQALDRLGQFTKPAIDELVGPGTDREASLMAVPGNVGLDAIRLGHDLGSLGGLGIARAYETIFEGLPIFRVMDLPAERDGQTVMMPSDFKTAGALGAAMMQDAKKQLVDPFLENGPIGGAQAIGQDFLRHPLTRTLDYAPAVGFGLKGLKAAGITDKAKDLAALGKAKAMEYMPEDIATKIQAGEAAGLAGKAFARSVAQNKTTFESLIRPTWEALTPQEKLDARAYIEGWHPDFMTGKSLSQPMQDYLAKSQVIADQMTKILMDAGHLDQESARAAKYLPYILETTRRADGSRAFKNIAEIMADPAMARQYINAAEMTLEKLGVKPQYSPWLHAGEVNVTKANPTKLSSPAYKAALDTVFGSEGESNFGRFKEKTSAGENIHPVHYDNLKTAFLQVSQFNAGVEQIIRTALNGVNNPSLYKGPLKQLDLGKNQLVLRHLENLMADMTGAKTIPGEDIAAALGGKLVLPASVHDALIKMVSLPDKVQKGWYSGWADIQRRYLLGFNPIYAEVQGLQEAFQLFLMQFRGPRDIIPSIWSWVLTSNKDLRKLIPEEIAEFSTLEAPNFFKLGESTLDELSAGPRVFQKAGERIGEGLEYAAGQVKNARLSGVVSKAGELATNTGKAIERYADFNLYRSKVYDAGVRAAATYYYVNDIARQSAKAKKVLDGMIETSVMKQRLELAMADPETVADIAIKVNRVVGDFSSMPGPVMQKLRSTVLWASYYREFFKYISALPIEAPVKTAMLSRFSQIEPLVFGDEDLPEYASSGTMMHGSKSPDGRALAFSRTSISPLATIGDIPKIAASVFGKEDIDTGEGITSLNGVLQGLIVFAGLNPATMRPFRDYELVSQNGQQLSAEDLRRGKYKPLTVTPDYVEYFARSFFGFPVRLAEKQFERIASGGEPSSFTSVMPIRIERGKGIIPAIGIGPRSAPKKVTKTGAIMPARPWAKSIDEFLNLSPSAFDLNRERINRAYKYQNLVNGMRAAGKQGKL